MKKTANRKNTVEESGSNEQEQARTKREPEIEEERTADTSLDGRRGAKDQTGVFFDRLRQAPEDYWDDHTLYLYRRFPRVARNGKPHYEATYRRAVDEEFLKSIHGSGAYLLKLNDNKKTIDQTSVEIQDISSPPRIDARELVDCPENQRYRELWPDDKSSSVAAANNGDAAVKELAVLLKTVLTQKGASEADPIKATLVNWALRETARERAEERKENSPAALASLLETVKGILPAQPQSERDKVDMLDRVWSLVERAQKKSERSDESKPDLFANITQAVDLFGKLKTAFAPESPAPAVALANPDAELWEKVAVTISGQVSHIVASLPGIIAAFKMNGAVPPIPGTPPGVPPLPTAFNPYDPMAMKAYTQAQKAQQPGPQTSPQATAPAEPSLASNGTAPNSTEAAPGVGTVHPVVLVGKALDCLNRGFNGHEFAHSVIVSDGDLAYNQIVAQIRSVSIPVLFQMAKQLPELNAQVTAYEGPLKGFVEEFIAGPEYEEHDDEPDAPAKTAASA